MHTVSPQDRKLFRSQMGGVTRYDSSANDPTTTKPPLQHRRRTPLRPSFISRPVNSQVREDKTHTEFLEFCWDDLPLSEWRKLIAGEYHPAAELDLHGCTEVAARRELDNFFTTAARCVCIIHGKGLRSGEAGGVLKPFTAHYLKTCDAVQAFCSARPQDGGTGAVYVLLRAAT